MLDLFGWDVGFSGFAALLLIVGALAIGVIAHLIGTVRLGYEWAITGAAALVGGYIGSESFGTLSTLLRRHHLEPQTWYTAIETFAGTRNQMTRPILERLFKLRPQLPETLIVESTLARE